jgi:DNA-binding NtrC family response regulator
MTDGNRIVQNVFQQIGKMACGTANVHIYGESGTGKLAAAVMIHKLGGRTPNPLVTIDCAMYRKKSMDTGCFEIRPSYDIEPEKYLFRSLCQAGQGTLILDGVNRMRLDLQDKFIWALKLKQNTSNASKSGTAHSTTPRIVTTSRRAPESLLRNKTIKPEVFEYLNPTIFNLKPLRNCKEDLPALANHYANYFSNSPKIHELPESIMRRLLKYDWPGNLYELQNTIQRYLAYDEITFLPVKTEALKIGK